MCIMNNLCICEYMWKLGRLSTEEERDGNKAKRSTSVLSEVTYSNEVGAKAGESCCIRYIQRTTYEQ